jgi:uncharacterized protein (TIGR02421 family)
VAARSGGTLPRLDPARRTDYLLALQEWNVRLAAFRRSVRVLEAVRWPGTVEHDFFARGACELPRVTAATYRPLPVARPLAELRALAREVRSRLADSDPAGRLLLRRAKSSALALQLIDARGTPAFARLSRDLYGTARPKQLRDRLTRLTNLLESSCPPALSGTVSAAEAGVELERRLCDYFGGEPVRMRLVEELAADACVGGDVLKLRRAARFSAADIDLLEVHEGWVHLGTAFNGRRQPVFAALGTACPGVTATQEGLAVLTEFVAGTCHPHRRRRLTLRLRAVMMAEDGADFLEVYRTLLGQDLTPAEAYRYAARVFRGGLPTGGGPFTKDLGYGLGLLALADRLREAQGDEVRVAGLLFCGKVGLADLGDLAELHANGLLAEGEFVPAPFRDRNPIRAALTKLASV